MYLKLESEGKNKGESRWKEGIFFGIRDESGEIVVGTNEGTVKARTLRRYGREEDRWKRNAGTESAECHGSAFQAGVEQN